MQSLNQNSVYYADYLKLDSLLGSQKPLSRNTGEEAHDETLFIIVHQVYELWFKQILHEIDSIIEVFKHDFIEEKMLYRVTSKLERIIKIQSLLQDQLEVMETMTPMDFLEFRDLLIPASGFQSVQFREIEIKMGLSTRKRARVDTEYFLGRLSSKDQKRIKDVENSENIFDLTEHWLERIPFTKDKNFNFWRAYKENVENMLSREEKIITDNRASLPDEAQKRQLENLNQTRKTFEALFSIEKNDFFKLSKKAVLNALFIFLYRDEPILQQPFRYLTSLMNIDENFTAWRYRHSLMAQRMLGSKIGTGGSSGHGYLKMAAEKNRIFVDLFNLSTFLIPRSELPKIPQEIKKELDFHFGQKKYES